MAEAKDPSQGPADRFVPAFEVESPETFQPPAGWTFLVHGTNTSENRGWDLDADEVTIDRRSGYKGLSVITAEDAERGKAMVEQSGMAEGAYDTTAGYQREFEGGEPVTIKVLFYTEDMQSRLVTKPEHQAVSDELDEDTQTLVDLYYRNQRHPFIPRGEVLHKIGGTQDPGTGEHTLYYVPESVADQFAATIESE